MREGARLRLTRDLERVRSTGARASDRLFAVSASPGGASRSRLAVSATAAVGTSVRRNRARRRTRAAFAPFLADLRVPFDLVVAARPSVVGAPFAELRASARRLLAELGAFDPLGARA